MTSTSIATRYPRWTSVPAATAIVCLCLLSTGVPAAPQDEHASGAAPERDVPDTYTAVTANMKPSGVTLRFVVTQWSNGAQRADVVAALNDAEDPVAALAELPTMGIVWRSGSAVGTLIKYADRQTVANGDEVVTLVTAKPLGPMSRPWVADDASQSAPSQYSVVQMNVNAQGTGVGTISLAADVLVEPESTKVSLDRGETVAPLLTEVARVPKPYWAQGSSAPGK